MIAQCNVRYVDTCAIDVRARTDASLRAIDLQAIEEYCNDYCANQCAWYVLSRALVIPQEKHTCIIMVLPYTCNTLYIMHSHDRLPCPPTYLRVALKYVGY